MDITTNSPASLLARPTAFLQPTGQLNSAFLAATKQFLDPVAAGVSEAQAQRQQEQRRKRKRGEDGDGDIRVLHLKKVHLQGFSTAQVWQQASKILDAAVEEIELSLPREEEDTVVVRAGESDEELDDVSDLEDEGSSIGEEGVDWEYDGEDVSEEEGLDLEEDEDEDEGEDHLDGEEIEMEDGEGIFSDEDSGLDEPSETYKPDPNGLNDPFFDIEKFNLQTDLLEQKDTAGAPDEDSEIDWDENPFSANANKNAAADEEDGDDDDDDEEGGPTFGNVDLNAPEGESDDDELQDGEMDAMDEGTNANNVMYADFFAPPASKVGKSKKKRGRPNPHNFPSADDPQNNKPDEDDIQNVISRVHGDLFSDEDDLASEDDLSDVDPSDPKSRRSTHERRQAKIAEQIRKLEAANVQKRGWQLS